MLLILKVRCFRGVENRDIKSTVKWNSDDEVILENRSTQGNIAFYFKLIKPNYKDGKIVTT